MRKDPTGHTVFDCNFLKMIPQNNKKISENTFFKFQPISAIFLDLNDDNSPVTF